jgi:hypothetical protein
MLCVCVCVCVCVRASFDGYTCLNRSAFYWRCGARMLFFCESNHISLHASTCTKCLINFIHITRSHSRQYKNTHFNPKPRMPLPPPVPRHSRTHPPTHTYSHTHTNTRNLQHHLELCGQPVLEPTHGLQRNGFFFIHEGMVRLFVFVSVCVCVCVAVVGRRL